MPMHDAFWGGRFGMFADRFGDSWMVSFRESGRHLISACSARSSEESKPGSTEMPQRLATQVRARAGRSEAPPVR